MANAVAIFITTYTVGVMLLTALTTSNLFLQVSAWILAVVFAVAVIQNLIRGKR